MRESDVVLSLIIILTKERVRKSLRTIHMKVVSFDYVNNLRENRLERNISNT